MFRPWQIKFSVMYVPVLMFYIICSLTYFNIKISFVRVKQKIHYIPREHKFWQLNRLDEFTINAIANLLVYERFEIPEAYSEPRPTTKMELFAKIVND